MRDASTRPAPPPAHLVAAAKALDSRGYWIVLDGGAVPSPFGARHVRGTVVNVPAGKDLRLQATLLQGDAVAAQAFFEAAGRMLIIRLELRRNRAVEAFHLL
ncbi:hypothetical protein AK812_SmicGene40306 [Symbiodinium microadriaticum]|uniref:Uncharacterized protein n=1 Tax=Symbiodinium microadriaticum TaxID=2951 RepID=A0A1Q9C905_SYMMI|nr:hypothetical protein AK812_SmicGene40306 [Symbiodinium microadriaticum]